MSQKTLGCLKCGSN